MKDVLMKYDDEWVLSLLQIIQANGNVYDLWTMEYPVEKIERAVFDLNQGGYTNSIITSEGLKIGLSIKGLQLFDWLCTKLNKRGLYKYLSVNWRQRQFRTIQDNTLYVPNTKNINKMYRDCHQ